MGDYNGMQEERERLPPLFSSLTHPPCLSNPEHHIFDKKQLCVLVTEMLLILKRKMLTAENKKIFNGLGAEFYRPDPFI